MEQEYGIKDLYNVSIKTTSDIEIGGKKYKKGELILFLDQAQLSTLKQNTTAISATGGKGNLDLVSWIEEDSFEFQLGISKMSPFTNALLNHGELKEINSKIPIVEHINPKNREIKLSHIPELDEIFLYKLTKDGYQIDDNYTIEGDTIKVSSVDSYMVSYYYLENRTQSVFFSQDKYYPVRIEAYATIRSSNTSDIHKAIIEIPKAITTSGLSLILGKYDGPAIQTLTFKAEKDYKTQGSCVIHYI